MIAFLPGVSTIVTYLPRIETTRVFKPHRFAMVVLMRVCVEPARYKIVRIGRIGIREQTQQPELASSVRTGSWTGPPRGKRAPRIEISSIVFGVRA